MEEEEIEIINNGNLAEISNILKTFLSTNENVFTFPNLSSNSKRILLWTSLFQHLQNNLSEPIHSSCLAVIRILSRDKSDIEKLLCEKWIVTLIEKAGLYNHMDFDVETVTPGSKNVTMEALKCLCNLAFNSEVARALCAHTSIALGIISRIRVYKEIPYKDDVMLFDMKLLFILTALRQDIKLKVKNELHGMDYLLNCLNDIMSEANVKFTDEKKHADEKNLYIFNDNQQAIVCEILKTQFNLMLRPGSEEVVDEAEDTMLLKLMTVLTGLLYTRTSSEDKLMELRSNVANLLTSVPLTHYPFLTPELNHNDTAAFVYEGRNMEALQALIELLQHRLNMTTTTSLQYENLSPILTVMNKCSRGCREQRKHLRQVVLPPLRDVSKPPEMGDTLRNQLCRLLTTPVTSIRDLVAEFLFILCKEKVGRMVKYTGFGNAAGHLAQKGLLCGGKGAPYSSSSDDSDTEEYLEAQPHIDPVVGCTRPPRANPFDGMSEEQKEHEAMKLVNIFDKMMCEGIVRPARIGPDGRPQEIEHVLELRDHLPNRPQSK